MNSPKKPTTHNIGEYVSKSHERRFKKLFYFSLIAGCTVMYGVLYGLNYIFFISPWLRADSISIRGNHSVPEGDVLVLLRGVVPKESRFAHLLGFKNMLIWPDRLSDKEMALLPAISEAVIQKKYRERKIEVAVVERKPYGMWCQHLPEARTADEQSNGTAPLPASTVSSTEKLVPTSSFSCGWFDEDGFLFGASGLWEGSLVKAVHDYTGIKKGLGNHVLSKEFLRNLLSIFDLMSRAGIAIREIRVEDIKLEEVRVSTYNGPDLLFSLRFPAGNEMGDAFGQLRKKPEFKNWTYIDFRVENRVYYK